MPDPIIGTHIGNYRVLEPIGEGACAHVYLGVHTAIDSRVAIKVLKPERQGDLSERFLNEARVVNHINHPNIVKIFDFGTLPDGRLYLVMEHLQGLSLADHLEKKGPLGYDEMLAQVRQIASALDAAHECAVVHRDLKPDNVFVVSSKYGRTVKLLDFGIAKLLRLEPTQSTTNMVIGTPAYMSPEQALGNVHLVSAASDIYSLGILVYELLTGELPYRANTATEALVAHARMAPTPIFEYKPDCPPAVWDVLSRALEKKPELRQPSAGDFYQSLAEALRTSGRCAATTIPSPVVSGVDETAVVSHAPAGDTLVSAAWEGLGLAELLREVKKSNDFARNIRVLAARLRSTTSVTDRILLLQDLMSQHRHLGQTTDAKAIGEEIAGLLESDDHELDTAEVQEFMVQRLATELGLFPAPWFRSELVRLLQTRLDPRNVLRVRGMLAQYESMIGRGDEAIALRLENLALARRREALHKELPFTLCHLTWECARARRAGDFETYARQLAEATDPADAFQLAHNRAAVTAGAVLLGQHDALWRFFMLREDSYLGLGPELHDFFRSDDPVQQYPDLSALRALIRMARRARQPGEALRLGDRLVAEPRTDDLSAWLAHVVAIERDLARALHDVAGVEAIRSLPPILRRCHGPASDFHPYLLAFCERFDGSERAITELEQQLDMIYY